MISLIVTVYNTPIKDLQRCFASIQNQTYRDFEVIVVDDGSKAEAASFLDQFAAEDPRFHVYHIENGGVSRARNIGLSRACGEYISFCDADDELTEAFLQHALSYVKTYHLDMISGGVLVRHKQHDETCACQKPANDIWIYTDMIPVLDFALTAYPKQGHLEFDTALIARVYPKLYKAELAKSVSFPEDIRMSEDNLYSFAVFSKCKRFGLVDETWVCQ